MSCRWAFNINQWKPSFEDLAKISGIIQPEEKKRISRFYFIKDAKASLVGRLMMRKLISRRLGIENTDILLSRDGHNKPILICPTGFTLTLPDDDRQLKISIESTSGEGENSSINLNDTANSSLSSGKWSPANPRKEVLCKDQEEIEIRKELLKELNFNVSHQGSFAVLASESSADRVGIDIMNISSPGRIVDRLDDYFRMMKRQFTDHEWVQIRTYYGTEESKQLTNFTRFWCLKESYVKAIGVGIIIDLRRIEFHTKSDLSKNGKPVTCTKIKVDGKWRLEWDFEERFLDGQHIVTVAKEYPKRIKEEDESEDLAAVEKESSVQDEEQKTDKDSSSFSDDSITSKDTTPEKSGTANTNQNSIIDGAIEDIPSFEVVQLDFLCSDMHLLDNPDYEWVDGFLAKK